MNSVDGAAFIQQFDLVSFGCYCMEGQIADPEAKKPGRQSRHEAAAVHNGTGGDEIFQEQVVDTVGSGGLGSRGKQAA